MLSSSQVKIIYKMKRLQMILKKVQYSQYQGRDHAWNLVDFCPQQINLVVGKNATGKTKTLNTISSLAHLITGDKTVLPEDVHYEFTWESKAHEICYTLRCKDSKVICENLKIDGEIKLERKEDSRCSIYFEEVGSKIEIQVTEKTLCCVARRDPMQHPWFEFLHNWAASTLHYRFGSVFGKNTGLLISPDEETTSDDIEIDLRKTDRVVDLFRKGFDLFGDIFITNIISSMKRISYDLEDITMAYSPNLKFKNPADPPPAVLRVKEKDLKCFTYQHEMSQGMFRALSLIIQLNLSRMQAEPNCIIIDDIGEGLDFERSTQLIRLLIEKVEQTSIQLIMSTNGRFTMNNVDLKYWSVIQRVGSTSKIFNYSNAKEAFEEFIFTGLSNFDFLSSEFYLKPPEEE